MTTTTIDLASLYTRGALRSVNESARTVDLIFSTGAPVDRVDAYGRYREILSVNEQHVRLERLNAGAPLLNSHTASSVSDVIGTVQPGSARIERGQGVATVRFSRRDDVEAIWQDVVDGIIRSVSCGYRVHKFLEDAAKPGDIAVRTAVDWEPYEVSLVGMPADAGAKVRAGAETNVCEIIAHRGDAIDNSTDADLMRFFRWTCCAAHVPFPRELGARTTLSKYFTRS